MELQQDSGCMPKFTATMYRLMGFGMADEMPQWDWYLKRMSLEDLRERLSTEWQTLGVVSALVLGMSISFLTSTFDAIEEDESASDAFVALAGITVALNFGCVFCSTALLIQLNFLLDEQLQWFVTNWGFVFLGLQGMFGLACAAFIGAISLVVWTSLVGRQWLRIFICFFIMGVQSTTLLVFYTIDYYRKRNVVAIKKRDQ